VLLSDAPHRILTTVNLASHVNVVGDVDGQARVSGAVVLKGLAWTLKTGGVWQASLPASVVNLKTLPLAALYVNGQPAIRARYPNQPDFLTPTFAPGALADWTRKLLRNEPATFVQTPIPNTGDNMYNTYFISQGGGCSGQFTPPQSYFCTFASAPQPGFCKYGYTTPGGIILNPKLIAATKSATWTSITAYMHAIHPLGWGGWSFQLGTAVPLPPTLQKGRRLRQLATRRTKKTKDASALEKTPGAFAILAGGFQEAHGDCNQGGGDFFLDNQLELLDDENEYFISVKDSKVYYKTSGNPNTMTFELAITRQLLQAVGSASSPIKNITVSNITFMQTYPTYMDAHEVPSGGDWTITRSAAVVLSGVEQIRIEACTFEYLGGNGILVSDYALGTTLNLNTFFAIGASAMLVAGNPRYDTATPYDYTSELRYPRNTVISNSWARNFGVHVLQSAAVFVSIAYRTTVHNCVFHDGPRAGVSLNDGFLGGHTITNNVMFNLVLLTQDHGPINSWDRQRWLLPSPGYPDNNLVAYNYLVGTTNGPLGIDLDDGSSNFLSHDNFLVKGALKLKGMNNAYVDNTVLLPLKFGTNYVTRGCVLANTADMWQPGHVVRGTTCVSQNEPVSFSPMWNVPCTTAALAFSNNTYWGSAWYPCTTTAATGSLAAAFSKWIAGGQDYDSTFTQGMPAWADMIALVRDFTAGQV